MYFHNMDIGLEGFLTTDSNSLVLSSKNDGNIINIRILLAIIKRLPKIKGIKEIMYPGQNKFNRYKQNTKKEIIISDIIKKDLELLSS